MEPPKRQSWRISVHAKSKGLDLRLSASNVLPQWGRGGERISLQLRIWRFFLNVESENGDPVRRGKTRSRLVRFFEKAFLGRWQCIRNNAVLKKNRSGIRNPRVGFSDSSIGGHCFFQGPITTMLGSLSLLSHSASEKDHAGTIIHAFSLFFYVFFIFKIRKAQIPLLLVAKIVSLIGFSLSYLSFTDLVPKAIWKGWNNIISLGCFTVLSQVIFSRLSLPIERHWMTWLIILALLSFFSSELSIGILIKYMKVAIKGTIVWFPNLLLTCQAFSHILGGPKGLEALGIYLSSAYFWGKKLIKAFASYTMTRWS